MRGDGGARTGCLGCSRAHPQSCSAVKAMHAAMYVAVATKGWQSQHTSPPSPSDPQYSKARCHRRMLVFTRPGMWEVLVDATDNVGLGAGSGIVLG